MTKIRTQISPTPVIARSLPGLNHIGIFDDEAISQKRLSRYFGEIAASEDFLNRIIPNSLLAMTGFKKVMNFDTWYLIN